MNASIDHEESELKESFGNKIKNIRAAENISRIEFARAVHIPADTIKNIELGKTFASQKVITRICSHPLFRKYALYIVIEEWDQNDENNPRHPIDIAQTTPDEALFEKLKEKLGK